MRTLPRLFGLLLLALLTGLLVFGSSSCETARTRDDRADPTRELNKSRSDADAALSGSASSKRIMQLNETTGKPEYQVSQSVIAASLIRQFHDGTVIDRVTVRQAPMDDPKLKGKGPYYLVGLGMNDGHFRAIALPLRGTDDGTFYLTPNADRYVLTGTSCPNCFFDFEDGHITGTTCDDGSTGGSCDLKVLTANQVFMHQ